MNPLSEEEALSLAREKWGPLAFTGPLGYGHSVGYAVVTYRDGVLALALGGEWHGPTWAEACYQAGILPLADSSAARGNG